MLVYLADLAHDYQDIRQYMPLNVGYLAAHAKSVFGERIEIRLFKSADKLLDAVDERRPGLVGLSNYSWNLALSAFAGRRIKQAHPELPVIMGGPNIGNDPQSIGDFLKRNGPCDVYCMYGSELSVSRIIGHLLELPAEEKTGEMLRGTDFDGCYSLRGGELSGNVDIGGGKDLDYIPSPYTTGTLDEFLDGSVIPLFESNRGCPYSCTFCNWGVSALNKLRRFSIERVKADLDYVAAFGGEFSEFYFADANFGILKRDLEIARHVRKLYDERKCFSFVGVYWSKSAQPHMIEIGKTLGHLTHTYVALQSLDDDVNVAIKRKNIDSKGLLDIVGKLRGHTHSTQTDILVGLPGETFESHLDSLDQALGYGINFFNCGEVRMLPGTEMDTWDYRRKYGIKTKYRLIEGEAGIYRDELVYEMEEVIRETSAMREEEMIQLRLIRSFFFGGVTVGEQKPLLPVLINNGVRVTDVYRRLIERKDEEPAFARAFDWLDREANTEFAETPSELSSHFGPRERWASMFEEESFMKLNFALIARLVMNRDEYEGYYTVLEKVLVDLMGGFASPAAVGELLTLCRQRNYITHVLRGDKATKITVKLSDEALGLLVDSGYLSSTSPALSRGGLTLAIDEVTASQIRDGIRACEDGLTVFSASQVMQKFWGRGYMEPEVLNRQAEEDTALGLDGFHERPGAGRAACPPADPS